MSLPFEPIRIVTLDTSLTEQSRTASGLRLMYLRLSQSPSSAWQVIFDNQRSFPRHSMWREAIVRGNHIVVDCPPDEIEKYHLSDLKEDVSATNEKYQNYLLKQQAEEKRIADEQKAEFESLETIKARLKFD